ncbi:MAG: hypothetical protein EOP10_09055 [Proteobacteria bacterium]|nr:MAG: hypothetical protein EOP10_09055 [Pseudomonadota bacterium]
MLKVWLLLLSSSYVLSGCVKYASGYQKSASKLGAESGDATAEEGEGEVGESEDTGEETSGEGEEGTAEEGGEGMETVSLLSTCESCHVEGGAGASVTLDSTMIPRLDAAATGANKDKHTTVAASFSDREALEAALTEMGLRLKAKK